MSELRIWREVVELIEETCRGEESFLLEIDLRSGVAPAEEMITTNHNSPHGPPYLRHAREREANSNAGWTVTLKIAIPKPRYWLVCSSGWIVIFLVYLTSTLWIGGFHRGSFSSTNNSSSWNKFLPEPVTTFLPIRAVHDTDPLLGPEDFDTFVSNAAPTSTWPKVVPSTDSASSPIVLSESKEEIEASGVTLPGSNPTNIDVQSEDTRTAHATLPDTQLRHQEISTFDPTELQDEPGALPSNQTTPESLVAEPADSTKIADFEVVDPNLVDGTYNRTSHAPAPVSNGQSSSIPKDNTTELSGAPVATGQLDRKVEDEDSETNRTDSRSEYSTSEVPVNDPKFLPEVVNIQTSDEETPWSKASVQSKEFRNSSVGDSSIPTRKHEYSISFEEEAEAPALEQLRTTSTPSDVTSAQNPDLAQPRVPTSTWDPSPAGPDSGMKAQAPPPAQWKSEVEPVIRATNITGRKAIEAFRQYLDCFSESGKWVYDPTPRHLPWNYVGEHYFSVCDGYHSGVWGDEADVIARDGAGEWSVREELKWVWQTNETCPLRQVDRNEFCTRLGPRRNIMVVGDSLNHGLSWELMNHLITNNGTEYVYQQSPDKQRISDGVYEMCGDIFGQGNGFKISFVRNDRLSLLSEPVIDFRNNFFEFPWIDLIQEYNVKILLLNRGAHYENDTIYEKALRQAFTEVKDRYPDVQVIYRNTPPGHANCTNMTAVPPLTERQQFGRGGGIWPDLYSWGLFAAQNVLARKIVEEFQYIYMDVDTMLALRADGHPWEKDCLHYCLPGPFDVAVQLFYNILPFL